MNKIYFHLHSSGSSGGGGCRFIECTGRASNGSFSPPHISSPLAHVLFAREKKMDVVFFEFYFFILINRPRFLFVLRFSCHIVYSGTAGFRRRILRNTYSFSVEIVGGGGGVCDVLAWRIKNEWKNDPCLFVYRINNSVHRWNPSRIRAYLQSSYNLYVYV